MSNEYPVDVDTKLATPLPIASPSSVGFSAERLSRIDSALPTGQLAFDSSPHECGRAREAAVFGRPFYALDQQFVDSQSTTHCFALRLPLHSRYASAKRVRDGPVHERARKKAGRALRNYSPPQHLSPRKPENAQRPFMFHYPSVLAVWSWLRFPIAERIW